MWTSGFAGQGGNRGREWCAANPRGRHSRHCPDFDATPRPCCCSECFHLALCRTQHCYCGGRDGSRRRLFGLVRGDDVQNYCCCRVLRIRAVVLLTRCRLQQWLQRYCYCCDGGGGGDFGDCGEMNCRTARRPAVAARFAAHRA